jgi:hypothetical protein
MDKPVRICQARDVKAWVMENKYSTGIENPPPLPHVCMRRSLRTRTRPTLSLLLLLLLLRGGFLRTSTRPTLDRLLLLRASERGI